MTFSTVNQSKLLVPSSSSSMIATATPSVVPPSESLIVGTAAAEESLPFALDVPNMAERTREYRQAENTVSPTASTSTRIFTSTSSKDRVEQEEEGKEEEKVVHAEVWTDYAMYADYYAVVLDKKEEVTAAATADNTTTTVAIPSYSLPRTNARQDDMVLASLLSGNIRGEPQLQHFTTNEEDQRMATTSATALNNSTSTSVLQQCQYAAQQAQQASTYLAAAAAVDGTQNVSLAVQSLYSSSNHYKAAAATSAISTVGSNRSTNSNSGYTGVATSLALLSKYHWKRAEAIRLATSHKHSSSNHENPAPPSSHPNQQVQNARKTSSQHSPFHFNNTRPTSATVTRIRDALHANPPEEDISASAFFGNTLSGNANPTTNVTLDPTTTKTGEATSTTTNITTKELSSTITISSIQNPVDDMLQLEKELHTMNMALSMHASVAHLQAVDATTSTPAKSYTTNHNTNTNLLLSQVRNAVVSGSASTSYNNSNLLDSSCWWGQSSFLHPRSDMASSISSWATTTSALCNIPINTTTKPTLMNTAQTAQQSRITSTARTVGNTTTNNSSGSDSLVHHTCPLDTDHTNTSQETDISSHYSNNNNNNNAKQVLRLLDALKVLGDENASLLEQMEEAKRARLEAKAAKEEMKRFQLEYQKKFHTLKVALDKLHQQQQQQQQLQITNEKANFILSSEILSSKAKDNTTLNQTRQQVQSLQLQLQNLQQESKKKDATLRKYENFYREVKARSAQRAAQRSASISSASSSSDVVN